MLPPELIRTIRRIEIRTRHLVDDSFAGEYQAIFKGRGMEFDEVRQYQPGDEVRSIDWNVTARMGEPFVKRYVEERELTVMLAFDASASGHFGTAGRFKREIAAELGAVLAFSAISNNDKVGLLAFTDRVELHIPPRKGRRHVLRLIHDLLAFQPSGRGTDIPLALDRLNRVLKRRAIIFLISDFLVPTSPAEQGTSPSTGGTEGGADYDQTLTVTNRRHDLVAVTLTDPREMTWPAVGLVALRDAETGATTWVDSGDPAWRRAFARQAAARQAARDAALTRAQVDRIDVTAGEDYVEPLLKFFKMRARRWRR
ncbi:MAG: DUF58 domain-containing protein [Anaerolineae bacterium]|jgi:uncharacterized protein (DUF58 family)